MASILGQEQTSNLSKGGLTENNIANLYNSKQHNEYSINGTPSLPNLPLPSSLDLNGQTPIKYTDNLPT